MKKRSAFGTRLIIVCALSLGIVFLAGLRGCFKGQSLAQRAAAIVKLPPEAVVTYVREDDWQYGNGQVIFTLPNTYPPEKWMGIIWKMNSHRPRSDHGEHIRYDYNTDQTWEDLSLEQGGSGPSDRGDPRGVHSYSYSAIFDK